MTAPPASVKQNGFIRVPTSFSMKWRKENETVEDGGADGEWKKEKGDKHRPGNNIHQYYSQRQPGSPVVSQRDAKKTTTSSVGKGRSSGLPVTSSPSPQSSPRTLPVSKSGSKPSQTAFGFNGTKQTLNSLSGSKPRSGTNGSLRPPQSFARPSSGPGSRSGSPLQKKTPASRSHSSDSLGSAPSVQLTESDRFRSRSLTQVRRQPSPTLTPSSTSSSISRSPAATRSYSINRAAGRGASSAQAPPRGSLAKSPGTSQTSQFKEVQSSAAPGRSGFSIPSLLPPSALKKPLLSSLGPASKPSGISYKLSRPSLIKQARPLRVTTANEHGGDQEVNHGLTAWRNSVETPSTTENSPGILILAHFQFLISANLILSLLFTSSIFSHFKSQFISNISSNFSFLILHLKSLLSCNVI